MWVPYVVSGCLQIYTISSCGVQLLFEEGPVLGGGGTSLSEPNGDVPLDGVSFSIELYLNGVAHFWIFGVRKFFTSTVSKHTRMSVL